MVDQSWFVSLIFLSTTNIHPWNSLAATALMVTHNMEHALRYGNRLLIMHEGKIIVDLNREQRSDITVNDLLTAFERASGEQLTDDSILLHKKGSSDNDEVG